MQLPWLTSDENHAMASADAATRTTGIDTAHERGDHGFAEAVDRLTRALQTGCFEVPADSEPR